MLEDNRQEPKPPGEQQAPERSTGNDPASAEEFDDAVNVWEEEETRPAESGRPGESKPPAEQPEPMPAAEGSPLNEISAFLEKQFGNPSQSEEPASPAGAEQNEPESPAPSTAELAEQPTPQAAPAEPGPKPTVELTGSEPKAEPAAEPEELAFFPIPDDVALVPQEDTAESPAVVASRRSSPLARLFNLASWFVLVLFFCVVAYCLLYYRYASDRLKNGLTRDARIVDVTIRPGESFTQIVEQLRAKQLLDSYLGVDDRYLMRYLAKVNGNSDRIKAGVYRLHTSMGLNEIYEKLIQGSQDFKITIPEGKTIGEIAAIVKRKVDSFDQGKFTQLTRDPSFIAKLGLNVPTLEGYLYPSTYFFGPGMKEEELVRMMVKAFRDNVEPKLRDVEKKDEFTFHQHVILASLIEREARIDRDRPLIASVLLNRLRKGMPLQVDATVLYALNDWAHPLTLEDLKLDSPYNTYKVRGLPPGPICSPRAASIVATFLPATTNHLFYVYKGDGSHAFADTYEEHKRNIQQYRRSQAVLLSEIDPSAQPATSSSLQAAAPSGTASASPATTSSTAEQKGPPPAGLAAASDSVSSAPPAAKPTPRPTAAPKSTVKSGTRSGAKGKAAAVAPQRKSSSRKSSATKSSGSTSKSSTAKKDKPSPTSTRKPTRRSE